VGAGPVTGSLERPSQGAPENRKASETRQSDRDPIKGARHALRGLHAAERQVMLARHAAERRQALDAAGAAAASERSTAVQAISAKYADKLVRVFDSGDARSAHAARERLKLEEAIELAGFQLAHGRRAGEARRTVLAGLRITQRSERHGLTLRQRRQRAVLSVFFTAHRRRISAHRPAPDHSATRLGKRPRDHRFWHLRPPP
jgi:hypothetical protein